MVIDQGSGPAAWPSAHESLLRRLLHQIGRVHPQDNADVVACCKVKGLVREWYCYIIIKAVKRHRPAALAGRSPAAAPAAIVRSVAVQRRACKVRQAAVVVVIREVAHVIAAISVILKAPVAD